MSIKDLFKGPRKIPANKRQEFYGFLSTLVRSGGRLQDSSEKVAGILEAHANEVLLGRSELKNNAKLYRHVEREMKKGNPLSVSLRGMVPDGEIMMLVAGERGSLVDGLEAAMIEAKSKAEIKTAFVKGLAYPMGLLVFLFLALNWIGSNLLPTLAVLVPVEQWTDSQQKLYWITTNVPLWAPIFVAILVALGLALVALNNYLVGRPREMVQVVPPFNIVRKMTGANYLTTLSSLMTAGETLKDGLRRMRSNTSSKYLQYYLGVALARERSGSGAGGPGAIIGSKLFTPWIMVKLRIYGEGSIKDFADKMLDIAEDARVEAIEAILGGAKLVNLLVLLLLGSVIGYTAITMYSIVGTLQGGSGPM
jgi:type II secretory pathway component PulF